MNTPAQPGLRPPLAVRPDLPPLWQSVDLDFDTAANKLVETHEMDGTAHDLPVMDLRTWAVRDTGPVFALQPLSRSQQPLPLRNIAFSGLVARLGAPAEFLRERLPAELQLATLNYLLASHDRPLPSQLRLRDNEVTALVSDRYAALDAPEFVDSLRSALKAQGVLDEVRVRALATGTTDALRLVFPGEKKELKVGDVSHVGLDVSTSSFGKSAVHVSGVVWRLVCDNGLRAPQKMGRFSFRHVGETQRLQDGLRDAVPTALFHARGLMGLWQTAVTTAVEDVAARIERLRELTQAERGRITEALQADLGVKELPPSTSAYELVNAITQAAHEAETARRLEMETVAGRVLEGVL